MMRLPSRMSTTDTMSATAILTLQRRSDDQPQGVRSSLLADDSQPSLGVGLPESTGPSGDAMATVARSVFLALRLPRRDEDCGEGTAQLDRTWWRCLCCAYAIASRVTTNPA